jgi:hypothetical protein
MQIGGPKTMKRMLPNLRYLGLNLPGQDLSGLLQTCTLNALLPQ